MRLVVPPTGSDSLDFTTPCRTLAEYIGRLVDRLGEAEPALRDRLREVVGARRARIRLDDETVLVRFNDEELVVLEAAAGLRADGAGGTDRETTLDLLAGRVEVTDAILDGRLDVTGEIEDIIRMFGAIEILLDAATRAPALQHLALDYTTEPCRPARAPIDYANPWRRVPLDPDTPPPGELEMLRRLDLLP